MILRLFNLDVNKHVNQLVMMNQLHHLMNQVFLKMSLINLLKKHQLK